MILLMIILLVFGLACFLGRAFVRTAVYPDLIALGLAFVTVADLLWMARQYH